MKGKNSFYMDLGLSVGRAQAVSSQEQKGWGEGSCSSVCLQVLAAVLVRKGENLPLCNHWYVVYRDLAFWILKPHISWRAFRFLLEVREFIQTLDLHLTYMIDDIIYNHRLSNIFLFLCRINFTFWEKVLRTQIDNCNLYMRAGWYQEMAGSFFAGGGGLRLHFRMNIYLFPSTSLHDSTTPCILSMECDISNWKHLDRFWCSFPTPVSFIRTFRNESRCTGL